MELTTWMPTLISVGIALISYTSFKAVTKLQIEQLQKSMREREKADKARRRSNLNRDRAILALANSDRRILRQVSEYGIRIVHLEAKAGIARDVVLGKRSDDGETFMTDIKEVLQDHGLSDDDDVEDEAEDESNA